MVHSWFDREAQEPYIGGMEELARDTESLVHEAVERLVDYDQWFLGEVEKGLAAADRGELIDHEDVGKLIDRRYPG
jgi:predicted transcriptional regulator